MSCASAPKVITETKTVEVMVPVTKAVDAQYTDPIAFPAEFGQSIYVSDAIQRNHELYQLLDQCNADREKVKQITTP